MFTNIQSFFLKCQWVGGGRESRLILFFKLKYQSAYFLVKKKKNYSSLWHLCQAGWFFFFFFLFICIFLFWSSCPFSKTKKILEMGGVCWWAHNNVNTINAIELYIQKWLKWPISRHVSLPQLKIRGKFLIKKYWCWLSQPQINIPSVSPFFSLL